jgi:hypothetical protein
MWEINLAGLTTAIERLNPGLSNINIYGTASKIQTNIPQEVFVRNGALTLEILSMDGKRLCNYSLQQNQTLDASMLPSANYVYLLKSKKAALKSGIISIQ